MLRRRSGTTSLPNFNSLSQGFPADRIGGAGPRGFPCELSVVQTTRPGRPPERLQPSAFRWPFHFEGVACNGLNVQVAVDGERVDMLAATLTISPSGCRSPTGALPSSSINSRRAASPASSPASISPFRSRVARHAGAARHGLMDWADDRSQAQADSGFWQRPRIP